ncbi:MAG TPA: LysR substrate-binding domain-containing protein [Caulobacteraceae bacterium]|jgi:DNA-binding transcriptional LysR family regulator|nr:LysR substrate-binding domain-containing protein [Caulobacteraceae bacterium]
MHVDLTDLRLFRDIAEAGSITAGAARSHLALAAASTRIRHLEDDIGAALLIRSRNGVTLTAAGRALLGHARSMLAGAERLAEDLQTYGAGLAGEVRLLSNTNALTEFLPEALASFLAANPGVSVDVEERLSGEIVGLVAEGAADIGIVAGVTDLGALQTFPFRTDRFVLVTATDHPLASAGPEVAFADALGFDFVGLDRASALQRFLTEKAARAGRALKLRVQVRSFDAVCRLAEAGVGVGVAPLTTATRAAATMRLAMLPLTDDWALRELRLCLRDLDALKPTARRLADALRG